MKIMKVMNALIGATYDRRFISRNAKNLSMDNIDKRYYDSLVKKTGPSTHQPVQIVKSWYKAYQSNIKKLDMIEQINDSFTTKGFVSRIFNRITREG